MPKAAPETKASRAKKTGAAEPARRRVAPRQKADDRHPGDLRVRLDADVARKLEEVAAKLGAPVEDVCSALARHLGGAPARAELERLEVDGLDPKARFMPWDSERARAAMLKQIAPGWWSQVASAHRVGSYGHTEAVTVLRVLNALQLATSTKNEEDLKRLSQAVRFILGDEDPAGPRIDGVRAVLAHVEGWRASPAPPTPPEVANYLVAHFMMPADDLRRRVGELGLVPSFVRREGVSETITETRARWATIETSLAGELRRLERSGKHLDPEATLRVALRVFGMEKAEIDSALRAVAMREERGAKKSPPVK